MTFDEWWNNHQADPDDLFLKGDFQSAFVAGRASVEIDWPKPFEAAPSQEPDWITKLRHELMMSKITHNFTFSRDEVFELLNGKTAPSQEPTGYFEPTGDGDYVQVLSCYKSGSNVIPLYTHPSDAAAQIAELELDKRILVDSRLTLISEIAKLTDELAGVWIELKNERRKK